MAKKQLGKRLVPDLGGGVESGIAALLPGIDISSSCEQPLNNFQCPACGGAVQRRYTHGILCNGLGVRATVDQSPGASRLAKERREVQGRESVGRPCIRKRGVIGQQDGQPRFVTDRSSFEDVKRLSFGAKGLDHLGAPMIGGLHENRNTIFVAGRCQGRVRQQQRLQLLLVSFFNRL